MANNETLIERRVIRDENGSYREQVRFIPPLPWDDGEWRTVKISSVPIELGKEAR